MKILQSSLFRQKVKKLSKNEKLQLDAQIRRVVKEPTIGIEKKGDLKGVFVHKFRIKNIEYLMAYRFSESFLELIMLGPHQNYYRDLKRYEKSK